MLEAQERFVERMGLQGEQHGMARTAARLVGFFLMNPRSQSLEDIAELLHVSKASVSTNARLMEQVGLLERTSVPGDRRDYYRLGKEPWEKMFQIERTRGAELLEILEWGRDTLPPELQEQRENLKEWCEFLKFMLEEIDYKIARWRERRAAAETASQGMEVTE